MPLHCKPGVLTTRLLREVHHPDIFFKRTSKKIKEHPRPMGTYCFKRFCVLGEVGFTQRAPPSSLPAPCTDGDTEVQPGMTLGGGSPTRGAPGFQCRASSFRAKAIHSPCKYVCGASYGAGSLCKEESEMSNSPLPPCVIPLTDKYLKYMYIRAYQMVIKCVREGNKAQEAGWEM